MLQTNQSGEMVLHASFACPLCDKPVRLVIDAATYLGRWCSVDCRVTGNTLAEVDADAQPPRIAVLPLASA